MLVSNLSQVPILHVDSQVACIVMYAWHKTHTIMASTHSCGLLYDGVPDLVGQGHVLLNQSLLNY